MISLFIVDAVEPIQTNRGLRDFTHLRITTVVPQWWPARRAQKWEHLKDARYQHRP
jgi:hypothetical protein